MDVIQHLLQGPQEIRLVGMQGIRGCQPLDSIQDPYQPSTELTGSNDLQPRPTICIADHHRSSITVVKSYENQKRKYIECLCC